MKTIGTIEGLDNNEKKVVDKLLETFSNHCNPNSVILPKYYLMYRNNRDCEIVLYLEPKNSPWVVNNFKAYNLLLLIEVKGHSTFEGCENNQVLVNYNNLKHDALEQARISTRKFQDHLYSAGLTKTWIYHFVAFPNIIIGNESPEIREEYKSYHVNKHLLMYDEMDNDIILKKIVEQKQASHSGSSYFTSYVNRQNYHLNLERFKNVLSGITEPLILGDFDIKRVEILANKGIQIHKNKEYLENNNVLLTGTAGTGKTIILIKIAIEYILLNKNILFLTYNTSLAADIYRLLKYYFETFNKQLFETRNNYKIINIDQYVQELFEISKSYFNIDINKNDAYEIQFRHKLEIIHRLINELDLDDIRDIYGFNYGLILLDEAQDLNNDAVELIRQINNEKARFVAVDSPNQWLKKDKPIFLNSDRHWITDVKHTNYRNFKKIAKYCNKIDKHYYKFLNNYYNKIDNGKEDLNNDEIVVTPLPDGSITFMQDQKLLSNSALKDIINKTKKKAGNKWATLIIQSQMDENHSSIKEHLTNNNIDFWDGYDKTIRKSQQYYPNKVRIIDIESCRGLEGWTVIIRNIDTIIKKTFDRLQNKEHFTTEEAIERINNLIYIASTRAMCNLYITYEQDKEYIKKLIQYAENL